MQVFSRHKLNGEAVNLTRKIIGSDASGVWCERVRDSRVRHADHAGTSIRQRPGVLPWEHNTVQVWLSTYCLP